MPEGPFGQTRLTSVGPLVDDENGGRQQYIPDVDVNFKSSENMSGLADESVHLSVTSPPYNIGWNYGSYEDDLDFRQYKQLLSDVFSEVYRVLVPQGRLCINVPTLVRGGSEGGMSHLQIVLNILQDQPEDWREREVIVWDKMEGQPSRNSTFPEPWGVLLNNTHESVIVVQKPGRRRNRPSQEIRDASVYGAYTEDTTEDVWMIPPANRQVNAPSGEAIPQMPKELPRRLIKMYSYKTDTVLDPFLGSGVVAEVAYEEERNAVGYEVREDIKPVIQSRIPTNID
jgi:site-specific DNA-methyltransferase (adenine-specific)